MALPVNTGSPIIPIGDLNAIPSELPESELLLDTLVESYDGGMFEYCKVGVHQMTSDMQLLYQH